MKKWDKGVIFFLVMFIVFISVMLYFKSQIN